MAKPFVVGGCARLAFLSLMSPMSTIMVMLMILADMGVMPIVLSAPLCG